jgi:hypothetical protein
MVQSTSSVKVLSVIGSGDIAAYSNTTTVIKKWYYLSHPIKKNTKLIRKMLRKTGQRPKMCVPAPAIAAAPVFPGALGHVLIDNEA